MAPSPDPTDNIFTNFQELRILRDETSLEFVAELLTVYCNEGERIIGELAKQLEKPTLEVTGVDAFVHQLKGSSASVGAQTVKNACVELRALCQQKNRDGCLKTVETAKTEFYEVRNTFQTMLQQLERYTKGSGPKES